MKLRPINSEQFRNRPHGFCRGLSQKNPAKAERVNVGAAAGFKAAPSQVFHPELKNVLPVQTGEASNRGN